MIHEMVKRLIWALVKCFILSHRRVYLENGNREKAESSNPHKAYIYAFWHEYTFCVLSAHAWTDPYLTLTSRSKDGDYGDFVAKKVGFVNYRGSSRSKNKDKGGKEAIEQLVAGLQKGLKAGLTVDGPKGPRHVCKPGVVILASRTGIPILPVISRPSHFWTVNSWDKFKIPKPFSKLTVICGEPIFVEKDLDPSEVEKKCAIVASHLMELEKK